MGRLVGFVDFSSLPGFGDLRLVFLAEIRNMTKEGQRPNEGSAGVRDSSSYYEIQDTNVISSNPSKSSGSSPSISFLTFWMTLGVRHLQAEERDQQRKGGREGESSSTHPKCLQAQVVFPLNWIGKS